MISVLTSALRFAFRTVLLVLFLLFGLLPVLLVIKHYQRLDTPAGWCKADALAMRLAHWLLWFFGISVKVSGSPTDGPVLIAANHISWLDILALHANCPMGFVAKAEIEQWPVFSFIARTGGTIFHQRGSYDSAADVTAAMVQRLKQGRRVAIFPEGGILPGAEVRVFHARLFRAAIDAECPVQPVMVRYLSHGRRDDDILFRQGESMLANFARLLARPGAVADVRFLPVINSTGKPRRVLADMVRAAVISSYEADQ
jgi:1-acyl-sn-glycerol-3-phosphate acyltransferase